MLLTKSKHFCVIDKSSLTHWFDVVSKQQDIKVGFIDIATYLEIFQLSSLSVLGQWDQFLQISVLSLIHI